MPAFHTMQTTAVHNSQQTRDELLEAAYEEIWRNGFRAASIDRILSHARVTKGALYYHFKNKLELGYAVVDEIIREKIDGMWIRPLADTENPLDTLLEMIVGASPEWQSAVSSFGCPLNNLAQEMAPIDEGFRTRLDCLFADWRQALVDALRRGQQNGTVRQNIDPERVAPFVIAVCEGAIGIAKTAQDQRDLEPCFEALSHYLEALRPRRSFRT